MKTGQIIEIYNWYLGLKKEESPVTDNFSVNLQWRLRQNMKMMQPIAEEFFKMREEYESKILENYSSDEKSELVDEAKGQRKVKDEYIEDYQKDLSELNNNLMGILDEDVDLDFKTVDIDAEIELAFQDKNPTMADIDVFDILTFMDNKE